MSDLITIRKGIQILNKSNSFNHVQALVINNHKIVSFEKRKGTKDMLKSIRNNNLQDKILLKTHFRASGGQQTRKTKKF